MTGRPDVRRLRDGMPSPKNPGDRTKAHRLRAAIKHGQTLQPVDQLWLAEYEGLDAERQQQLSSGGATKDVGASRSARTIKLDIDEKAESIGTGAAAVAAASAALAVKEEGRRLDSLTMHSVDALKEAVAVYRDICLTLANRTEILEATHIEMLGSVRSYYLHAMQAEGALMHKEQDGDPSTAMLIALVAKHLGIDVPAGALPAGKKRTPPNGAAA